MKYDGDGGVAKAARERDVAGGGSGFRENRHLWLTGLCAVAVFMGACSTDPAGPSLGNGDRPRKSLFVDGEGHDLVARGIALAMREKAVRHSVRDAMRASLVTEHKLVLQEFIKTPDGETLVAAAAAAAGASVVLFKETISNLPLMDFYVPSAGHRKAWRGDGLVFVGAATGSQRSEVAATRSDGMRRRLTKGDWDGPSPVFFLEPAERKSRRINPQPASPGTTIQDPNDGQISGTLVEYRPDGTTEITELADYLALKPRFYINPDESGGGGGSIPPPDTTYLEHVIIISVCDNGACAQGNEFEWHTYFSTDNGATYGSRFDLRVEGVPSDFEGTWDFPALLKEIRSPQHRVKSDVVETDWAHPDDKFEPSPIWDYDNVYGRLKGEGDWRCDYPKPYGGTYTCGVYFWKEVNQSMRW